MAAVSRKSHTLGNFLQARLWKCDLACAADFTVAGDKVVFVRSEAVGFSINRNELKCCCYALMGIPTGFLSPVKALCFGVILADIQASYNNFYRNHTVTEILTKQKNSVKITDRVTAEMLRRGIPPRV